MKTLNTLISLILLILGVSSIHGQCNKTWSFSSQQDLVDFQLNYSNCTEVYSIYVGGSCVDLSALSNIEKVANLFMIESCTDLVSTYGLEKLDSIGGDFVVRYNDQLNDLDGLNGLSKIEGRIEIWSNPKLVSIQGIGDIGYSNAQGTILLADLPLLEDIPRFPRISSAKTISITGLNSIEEIVSFPNLDSVSKADFGEVSIIIAYNDRLKSINGFEELESIEGVLMFQNNDSLEAIQGFNELYNGAQWIKIKSNARLNDIQFFDHFILKSGAKINIEDNPVLSYCSYPALCDYAQTSSGGVNYRIIRNACGCNSKGEITDYCNNLNPCGYLNECETVKDFGNRIISDFLLTENNREVSVEVQGLTDEDRWFPIWDHEINGGSGYFWGDGMYPSSYEYQQSGEYTVCINIETYRDPENDESERCHCKIVCKEVSIK